MKTIFAVLAATSLGLVCATTQAALSDAELKQLGTTLTPLGAEVAGTADGNYPAYTGGVKAPASFDPKKGVWPDPYPNDKPVLSIDAKNMAQYTDKLMEGSMELMRRFPTYRIDVYPTRRSAWASDQYVKATLANARNPKCKLSANGVGIDGCWGGTPFPIPKSGYEAMWNHLLRERTTAANVSTNYLVNANGAITLLVQTDQYNEFPYQDPSQKPYDGSGVYQQRLLSNTTMPARDAGTITMLWYPLHADTDEQRAWQYTPGQRRVRLAPEFSYDTPAAQMGGTLFYDEISIFQGRMDRFDFKLLGKKLMYMPYNNYRMHTLRGDPAQLLGPKHFNPDKVRWELRRVWVVEATPLPGKRHVASKKRFYLDEDTWAALAYEGWDHSNKLFRVMLSNGASDYVNGGVNDFMSATQSYDLTRGQYTAIQTQLAEGSYYRNVPRRPENDVTPASMARSGVR